MGGIARRLRRLETTVGLADKKLWKEAQDVALRRLPDEELNFIYDATWRFDFSDGIYLEDLPQGVTAEERAAFAVLAELIDEELDGVDE